MNKLAKSQITSNKIQINSNIQYPMNKTSWALSLFRVNLIS
ncbi:hypothetical protein D1AOALGA4SA_9984 [Olavius algarvensis Delta 1 endosymbiont]|nr:hypothetical protein D1AOALGA4SA_9984 [Olavius algarvensis Delta 1 endosymbiont]